MTQAAPITVPDLSVEKEYVKEVPKTPPAEVKVLQPTPHILTDLISANRLLISRFFRLKTALKFKGTKNRYYIRTEDGSEVFTVEEDNKWWVGYVLFGLRPLRLRVVNNSGDEVLLVKRAFALTSRILPCQLQRADVFTPQQNYLGSVEQIWEPLTPAYVVRDGEGQQLYKITGPRLTVSCYRDVVFVVEDSEGETVAETCKRWMGLNHALFKAPMRDFFGIAFEKEMPVEHKALLLAATLLIEYMYY